MPILALWSSSPLFFQPKKVFRRSTTSKLISRYMVSVCTQPSSGESTRSIGFIGLNIPTFDAPFTPCVEVLWRLDPEYWGQGIATEGARAVTEYGFQKLGLPEIVAFTVPANVRSRRVMERLGMRHDSADDFDHPRLPTNHALCRHVLYRLSHSDWRKSVPAP